MSAARCVETTAGGGFYTRFDLMPVGRPIGSKKGMVAVACPKCGKTAWKKSEREYVHTSETFLDRNEPKVEARISCQLTKHEAECVMSGKPIEEANRVQKRR